MIIAPDILTRTAERHVVLSGDSTIHAGHYRTRTGYGMVREKGSNDWLLIYTVQGAGRIGCGSDDFVIRPGDIISWPQGVFQDYRTEPSCGSWEILWAHFIPRPHWQPLLAWPRRHGLPLLSIAPGETRKQVMRVLREMCRLFAVPVYDHEAFSMNALEQALLYCARANPLGAHGGLDSRVIMALEQIGARLAGPLSVPRLALDCGLSTSRLAHLFQEQVGMPPRDYIEQERLRRARELLETSAQTVSEIAYAVGFSSPSYFSRRFTAIVGSMPREYRRRMRASRISSAS